MHIKPNLRVSKTKVLTQPGAVGCRAKQLHEQSQLFLRFLHSTRIQEIPYTIVTEHKRLSSNANVRSSKDPWIPFVNPANMSGQLYSKF